MGEYNMKISCGCQSKAYPTLRQAELSNLNEFIAG
jgi:hypothetical protein